MSLISKPPQFEPEEILRLVREHYGIEGCCEALPSERDQNLLIRTESGASYVCKINNSQEDPEFLQAQNQAMALVGADGLCPEVVRGANGEQLQTIEGTDGCRHLLRLHSFLPGKPLAAVGRHSLDLLEHLGVTAGRISHALADFDHPALHRHFHWDLADALEVVAEYQYHIDNDPVRSAVQSCDRLYRKTVVPRSSALRRSVIHNDINDYNVIVEAGPDPVFPRWAIAGVIDFGDMVHSFTVADVAVAVAYAVLGKTDPLAAAAAVVRGYHRVFTLHEDEIAVLWPLATMRLCVSACHAAHQQQQRPHDPYLSISQDAVQSTLPGLIEIPPGLAEAALRAACGLAPVQRGEAVARWLRAQGPTILMATQAGARPPLVLDLGVASPLVHGDPDHNSTAELESRIRARMRDSGTSLAIGRYDEPRLVYSTPLFADGRGLNGENRTIHLGLDLFCEAGTEVLAPLAGRVHRAGFNRAELDYGGVVLLEHTSGEGDSFFTLYGHLAHAAVQKLSEGQEIDRGEAFATLGDPSENGGWPPHLHFQIILDLLDQGLDFPGVCRPSEKHLWTGFSPDPNLLLQLPPQLLVGVRENADGALASRRRHVAPSLSLGYSIPLKIERGWKQYLFDHTGRRFLDAYNNVPHVGHCHPRVVAAARQQMETLNTNTRYLHDKINLLAERLSNTMPDPLSVCFFVNSASEGNELALRLARTFTGREHTIVLESAYHGHTNALIDISPYKHDGPGGRGAPEWVHSAPVADTYRGRFKADDPQAATLYALEVQRLVEELENRASPPCAFIAESYPSVGGQIIFPDGYLRDVYRCVRAAGGLCIADEVQTGYGRIGSHLYAFEAQGVVPDIVVLGKPIGNGHPLSAVVTTREIAEAFDNGMEFFSTFGGNTVSCAVGLAVLDVLEDEQLQSHAETVGKHLLQRLTSFAGRYPLVGDVRGAGLFLGVELVRDRQSLEPATAEAGHVADRMREEGVLIGTDGPYHNVLKIRPPMPFSRDDADLLTDTMAAIFEHDF